MLKPVIDHVKKNKKLLLAKSRLMPLLTKFSRTGVNGCERQNERQNRTRVNGFSGNRGLSFGVYFH